MGNFTSKQWEEMTEVNQAQEEFKKGEAQDGKKKKLSKKQKTIILRSDPRSVSDDVTRTPIAIHGAAGSQDTPCQDKIRSVLPDPRSPPVGELERTPIVVEENQVVRKRLLETDSCATPVRGHAPAAITLPAGASSVMDDRSPLVIESGSQEAVSPLARPALISASLDSPATVDLGKLDTATGNNRLGNGGVSMQPEKKKDRGQPSQILQNKLKSAMAQANPSAATPPSAVDMNLTEDYDSDANKSGFNSNDVSLVI